MSTDWLDEEREAAFLYLVETAADIVAQRATPGLELIDWSSISVTDDAIVEGLLHRGRWTANASAAKSGKSTFVVNATVHLSEGRDPFDRTRVTPSTVLYVDAEMGRLDLNERIIETGHDPSTLTRFFATDLPPRLDTEAGGLALLETVRELGADIVIIDGINGTVSGAENDDTTWRAFYQYGIAPLKREGVAILTNDNLGKEEERGPRGSSVKVDKADAVIKMKRSESGVTITTTHRRTAAYPLSWSLSIAGLEGDEPLSYRRTSTAWPEGTSDLADTLDRLKVPPDYGRGKAREILAAHNIACRDTALSAALRYRRIQREQVREQVEMTLPEQPQVQVA